MFQLTNEEEKSLRSQFVTLENEDVSLRGKHRKYNSYVFTEQGVYMLAKKLEEIEKRVFVGEETDRRIIEVLNELMAKDERDIEKIGFVK